MSESGTAEPIERTSRQIPSFPKKKEKNVSENRKQVAEELWLYFVEFRNASWGNEDRNSCVLEAKVNAQFS